MSVRVPPGLLRWSLLAALVGAVLGLGLFALETERLLSAGVVGVGIDVEECRHLARGQEPQRVDVQSGIALRQVVQTARDPSLYGH